MREISEKSIREKRLPYVKKMKKWPKKRFTHTFFFHVEKKKTLKKSERETFFWPFFSVFSRMEAAFHVYFFRKFHAQFGFFMYTFSLNFTY